MHVVFSLTSTTGVRNVLDLITRREDWFPRVSNEQDRAATPVSERTHTKDLLQTHT